MKQPGRMRGWLGLGLAAALLVPLTPVGPVSAAPFDYIKKADEEKQKSQEREQQERQREQQQEQDRRAQEARQREQQERQREQQDRSRQEQERRAAEERQRQAEQQRQAQERQRQQEQQRQAERQREQQERQREQQERAKAAQEARERQQQERSRTKQEQQTRAQQEQQAQEAEAQRSKEAQAQEERARQAQQEQPRQAQEEQNQRTREAQAQEEQARRARQEQVRQQLMQRQQEQPPRQQNAPRQVAAGPFDYIRKADQARGRPTQQPAPRSAPVQREQPRSYQRDRGQSTRPGSFGTSQPQREPAAPYRGNSQARPGSSVREYPFGTVRRAPSPAAVNPPTHTERTRPFGSAPAPGSVTAPTPGPSGSGPFGSVRTREPARAVTPVPRSGRGSLDSYFGRQPQRHRERGRGYDGRPYYPPGGYYPGGYNDPRYPPHYYDPCPYDYYPPVVIYPRPSPHVVIVPAPEVVIVPEQERLPDSDRDDVESATLEEVLGDVEAAWVTGKLDLLMRHVRSEGKIQVYRDGEWTDALTREAFEEKTAQAFREYDTVSMTFSKPKLIGANEASARAEHVYKTDGDREQRVFVTYSFRRSGRTWKIVGLDYERPARAQTDPAPDGTAIVPEPSAPAPAAPPSSSAPMPVREYMGMPGGPGLIQLVSAPPARVKELLAAPRPRRLATLKQVRNGQRTLYTLEAMRGVAPGTLAWALYRQGEKRPRETGVADVGAMPAGAWIAVRTVAPPVMTLAAGGPARPAAPRGKRTLRVATRTFADPNVALVAVQPPTKTARPVAPVRAKGRGAKK